MPITDAFSIYHSCRPNTVSVFIGENGTGKSSTLAAVASIACGRNTTIPIATSIYDKFNKRQSPRYRPLKASIGRSVAQKTILKALIHIDTLSDSESINRLRRLGKILQYVNYLPQIGIKLIPGPVDPSTVYIEDTDEGQAFERAIYAYNKWRNYADKEDIAWIDAESSGFKAVEAIPIINLADNIRTLKEKRIANNIELFLNTSHGTIPLLHASSGELTYIITMLHIAAYIENNTFIIIDEPESSLHPKWQRNYISTLLDLFQYYNPTILIATHSPLIIATDELTGPQNVLYKSTKDGLRKFSLHGTSIEAMLFKDFDTITPKSYFFSELIANVLSNTLNGRISTSKANDLVSKLSKLPMDERQHALLQICHNKINDSEPHHERADLYPH